MLSSASQLFPPVHAGGPAVAALAANQLLTTLDEIVRDRVQADPQGTAIIELGTDGEVRTRLTFAEVNARAEAIAAALPPVPGSGRNDHGVVLSVEHNADFLCGLVAVFRAQRFVVPIVPPFGSRHAERARSILSRTRFGAVIADEPTTDAFGKLRLAQALPTIVPVNSANPGNPRSLSVPPAQPNDLAIVQYTSGSTRDPRGVMLSHANVLANLLAIQAGMELTLPAREVLVSWLPPYHDMGLIGSFLNGLYLSATHVALPSAAFLRRPMVWLEAISRYGATFCGAPNFAYQLAADTATDADIRPLDLSTWRVAFNGSEPVSRRTCARFAERFAPARFAARAMYPCYGMAESVVMATGVKPGTGARALDVSRAGLKLNRVDPARDSADIQSMVACGKVVAGHQLIVVDPDTLTPLGDDRVGELMLAGPSVGAGYLDEPDATRESFGLTLGNGAVGFFRTGDLGFIRQGETYIAGRAKDLIIVNGENHHPADLEATAGQAAPELKAANCCAFAEWEGRRGTEGVVLVAAVRATLGAERLAAMAEAIQEALAARHGVCAIEIVFVKSGALPRTTSGKPQRQLGRTRLREGALPVLWQRRWNETDRAVAESASPGATPFERLRSVIERIGGSAAPIDPDLALDRLSLDSIDRVRLLIAIEDEFGVHLDFRAAAAWKTVGQLAEAIAAAPAHRVEAAGTIEQAAITASDPELEARQTQLWRDDILPRYATFQDITGLALDNPVQVLRIALAMDRFPGIGRTNAVALAQEWVRREQLTGWFYHVPRVQDILADPRRSAPDAWRKLQLLAQFAPAPAVVTLFHTSGWDWLLALLLRAAVDQGRPVAVLYDTAVAELNEPLQKRFDVLMGRNSRSLRATGAVVLVDIRDPNLEFTLVRLLDEKVLLISMPDAVHGAKGRAGIVEVPYLGGTMRLAMGLYRIAAMRGIPFLHVVHAHTADGPRVTIHAKPSLTLRGSEGGALVDAVARQLTVFTDMLAADPPQWRQWRALVPTPAAVPPPRPGAPWFDSNRFLVLDTGARVWLMCRISQRTFALPREAYPALLRATDETAFRSAVSALAIAPETLDALLLVVRGADPHGILF